jgi:hypothetical membrane protein
MKNVFKNKIALNYFSLAGILACVFYLLHDIIGAQYYPGYDFLSQAVSDLTASDAPSRMVAGGLSNVYGSLSLISSMAIVLLVKQQYNKTLRIGIYLFATMNLVSNLGYSLFPLSTSGHAGTFQDIMHLYVVTVSVVLLSISSLLLITIGGLKKNNGRKSLSYIALIALLLMMSGAIFSNLVDPSIFGLIERFSTYSAVLFTGVLGIYGYQMDGTSTIQSSE